MPEKRSENMRIYMQNGHQKGSPIRPKAYLFRYNFACDFGHVFEVISGSNIRPKWVQKWVQNVIKNDEKSSPAPE